MTPLPKRDYYQLIASLPEMVLDQSRAPFATPEFVDRLAGELTTGDFEQVRLLLLTHDNRNLLRLLQQETDEWDELGRYSETEMTEALREGSGLPRYFHRFQQAYRDETPLFPGQSWRNQLTTLYYDYALDTAKKDGFLHNWLSFDRGLRNVLAAWNIRRYELDGGGQYIGRSDLVEAVQKSSLRDFGLGRDYPYLEKLMNEWEKDDLQARAKAVDRLRWQYIDAQLTFYYFTVEVVLGYLLQLRMLERWLELDPEAGEQRLRSFISEVEQKITFS